MSRREAARAEAAFLSGRVGVDGQTTRKEDERDGAEVERAGAREQLLRSRTWLGREFLTWALWRSDAGDSQTAFEDEPLELAFVGRIVLRGIQGEVVELSAKGALAPYSEQVKRALDAGLLVHAARLRFTVGERSWEATLDAEHLDVRSAKLPELLTEDEDDRITERLDLADKLSAMVDVLAAAFLSVRASRSWSRLVVPEMKRWMSCEAKGRTLPERAERARASGRPHQSRA